MKTTLKRLARSHPLIERTARRVFDVRYQLARKHLCGTGLEIGALHIPLFLPKQAHTFYLDRMPPSELRAHYPELGDAALHVSLIGDGETLACIRAESLDFLVANHVIEHCQDPIGTIKTFASKLRKGGKIFMAVPEMTKTFDSKRTETTWEHLLADHQQGPAISRLQHFDEWARDVHGFDGDHAIQFASEKEAQDYSIHYHCWTCAGFENFIAQLGPMLPLTLVESKSWRIENIFILEKH
ncbi:MAG: methyltransferase domain-containing protein [bacterium]|nr:methyltransferase domain-containing protein [bacterium]